MKWWRFWSTLHAAAGWKPPIGMNYLLSFAPGTRRIAAMLEIDGDEVSFLITPEVSWWQTHAVLDACAADLLDVHHEHAREAREPIYPHPAERN